VHQSDLLRSFWPLHRLCPPSLHAIFAMSGRTKAKGRTKHPLRTNKAGLSLHIEKQLLEDILSYGGIAADGTIAWKLQTLLDARKDIYSTKAIRDKIAQRLRVYRRMPVEEFRLLCLESNVIDSNRKIPSADASATASSNESDEESFVGSSSNSSSSEDSTSKKIRSSSIRTPTTKKPVVRKLSSTPKKTKMAPVLLSPKGTDLDLNDKESNNGEYCVRLFDPFKLVATR